tara:strand:- start:1122 stop:1868 length:747 start_codon:yes stop_codon:yes gene_type:complete
MSDYAIIIPAYNEEAYLAATLASVRCAMKAVVGREGWLIVVDNNSTDRTAQVARENGADQVVFEPHNQIARARNAGAESTDALHLVFVDADTQVPAETLQKALELLASETVAGGGAGVVMDQPVTPMVRWITSSWNRVSARWQYAAGSFFFCRRDVFESVGGFDESVYAGEEVWFARRIKRWAKKQGMEFKVLIDLPVVTSARKSAWFSTGDFVMQIGLIFLFPWATRSKRFCGIWYRRPEESKITNI